MGLWQLVQCGAARRRVVVGGGGACVPAIASRACVARGVPSQITPACSTPVATWTRWGSRILAPAECVTGALVESGAGMADVCGGGDCLGGGVFGVDKRPVTAVVARDGTTLRCRHRHR